jgi:hypothetical protein
MRHSSTPLLERDDRPPVTCPFALVHELNEVTCQIARKR